jgi:hypothetical protein
MPEQRVQGFGGGGQYKRFVNACCPPIIASFGTTFAGAGPAVLSPPLPGTERMVLRLGQAQVSQVTLYTKKMDDPNAGDGAAVEVVTLQDPAAVGPAPTVEAIVFTDNPDPDYDTIQIDLNAAAGQVGDFFDLILTNDCGCCINVLLEIVPNIP